MNNAPLKPRLLMLMLTDACNLSCRYCYEQACKNRHGRMNLETIIRALNLCGNHNARFHVQLTGGEPTLEPDTLLWVLPYIREHYPKASISLQTNATCLTPKLAEALKQYRVLVGVSLDGKPEIQEYLRGQSKKTFQGMRLLREHQVPFTVTAVITEHAIHGIHELPLFLGAFPNAVGLGLDFLVQKPGINPAITLPTAKQIESAMAKLLARIQFINKDRKTPLKLREQEQLKKSRLRKSLEPYCLACSGESLAVGPNGELYPCTQTYGDENFSLGTLSSPTFTNLMKLSRQQRPAQACHGCPIEPQCPGQCPSRFYYNAKTAQQLECHLLSCLAQPLSLRKGIAI